MHLTHQFFVLAALGLGAIAQPAGSLHRHLHKHKRDVNWKDPSNYQDVNWSTVNYGASSTAAAPAVASTSASPVVVAAGSKSKPQPQGQGPKLVESVTTTAAASSASTPTPSAASSSPVSSPSSTAHSGSILYQPSNCPASGFGTRTNAVAGANVNTYTGNIGSPYGCNMRLVSSADSYDYTNTFRNAASAPLTIIIWNKAGDPAKGQGPNQGQSSAPTLGFTLAAGASQTVAFDANSQVAWSRNCDRRGDNGAPDCTWGEGDFGNASNQGWTGYDVSSIQNSHGNSEPMCITSAPHNAGLESSNLKNNWVTPDQPNQGAGGNIPPEAMPVRLLTVFG